jgi:hypothetical protein
MQISLAFSYFLVLRRDKYSVHKHPQSVSFSSSENSSNIVTDLLRSLSYGASKTCC